jgi:hypothetical protein
MLATKAHLEEYNDSLENQLEEEVAEREHARAQASSAIDLASQDEDMVTLDAPVSQSSSVEIVSPPDTDSAFVVSRSKKSAATPTPAKAAAPSTSTTHVAPSCGYKVKSVRKNQKEVNKKEVNKKEVNKKKTTPEKFYIGQSSTKTKASLVKKTTPKPKKHRYDPVVSVGQPVISTFARSVPRPSEKRTFPSEEKLDASEDEFLVNMKKKKKKNPPSWHEQQQSDVEEDGKPIGGLFGARKMSTPGSASISTTLSPPESSHGSILQNSNVNVVKDSNVKLGDMKGKGEAGIGKSSRKTALERAQDEEDLDRVRNGLLTPEELQDKRFQSANITKLLKKQHSDMAKKREEEQQGNNRSFMDELKFILSKANGETKEEVEEQLSKFSASINSENIPPPSATPSITPARRSDEFNPSLQAQRDDTYRPGGLVIFPVSIEIGRASCRERV